MNYNKNIFKESVRITELGAKDALDAVMCNDLYCTTELPRPHAAMTKNAINCNVLHKTMEEKPQIDSQKVKEILEFAQKSPKIVELQQQCQEIGERKRKKISEKVIDNAFDAFGIIVKELSDTSEEEQELQKFCAKYVFCCMVQSSGIEITD